ncbi:MAG: transposase [Roseiarcus sp.]
MWRFQPRWPARPRSWTRSLSRSSLRRRVWAPIGERPLALGHHRYQWLYVTAFVQPTGGETVWYPSDGVSKPFFEKLLADFAETVGAGKQRRIILTLDNAGWHGEAGLAVPEGLRLVFLPPYTPELQPAERLWPLVDEPIANRCFETLADIDAVLADRCRQPVNDPSQVAEKANFAWWPKPSQPK